jgi:pimeloyl-ACP methyl ester carboxylesterase
MQIFKRILFGLLAILLLAGLGFVVWAETPYPAAPEALFALASDSNTTVTVDDYITFAPTSEEPATGLIFYPGGRVDYRAYAAPLRRIAEEGYLVILMPVRLNLAFFDVNAADRVLSAFPQIEHWAIGGHSLGGVAAALYARENETIDGVVFWASYPADDGLKDTDLQVLSIYGTLDMGGMESFEASRQNLPADTEFVVIEGGNHAQFGDYGVQPGDNGAVIGREEQQSRAVRATVRFLEELSK